MTTKERVLLMLSEHRGENLSGAAIAAALGISRNAVWKAVNTLRSEGCGITAQTNRGYCLSDMRDLLSVQGIVHRLPESLRDIPIFLHGAVPSTNLTAKALALEGTAHGTVIIAHSQTDGKGRLQRSFVSPEGGLYMSVVLRPDMLPLAQITAVTMLAAVTVCEAIEEVTGISPSIKWVNDVLIGRKKVCGILTEAVTDFESGSIGWIVLGIGINVSGSSLPPALRDTAAALCPGAVPPDTRNRLAAAVLGRLLTPELPAQDAIRTAYRARLTMLGESVTVIAGDRTYPAIAEDIDSAGHLIVSLPDGTQKTLNAGEIRIRPETEELT